jgi:hypothetical protein
MSADVTNTGAHKKKMKFPLFQLVAFHNMPNVNYIENFLWSKHIVSIIALVR